jgi:signal transduction histidine kinase
MVGITVDQIQQGDEKTTGFHIVDTGIGIPPENLGAIMQSFGRIQTGGTDRDESRSSLEQCQRLARLLGGEITVRSAAGKGSTFTFVLRHKD